MGFRFSDFGQQFQKAEVKKDLFLTSTCEKDWLLNFCRKGGLKVRKRLVIEFLSEGKVESTEKTGY